MDSKPHLRHTRKKTNKKNGNEQVNLKESGENGKHSVSLEKERGSSGKRIGLFHEAPEHNKYLIYIKTGYRIGFSSFRDCLKSIFMVHNETVNIWTHLIGIFMYLFLAYYRGSFILKPNNLIIIINN